MAMARPGIALRLWRSVLGRGWKMSLGPYLYQEFKCNKCPGFFVVRLNVAIRGKVLMVCPMCGRKHQRNVNEYGVIVDIGKDQNESDMHKIRVPKAAFSKEPKTRALKLAHHLYDDYDKRNRNGAPIGKPEDLVTPDDFYLYEYQG